MHDETSSPYVQKIDPQLKSEIDDIVDKELEELNSRRITFHSVGCNSPAL